MQGTWQCLLSAVTASSCSQHKVIPPSKKPHLFFTKEPQAVVLHVSLTPLLLTQLQESKDICQGKTDFSCWAVSPSKQKHSSNMLTLQRTALSFKVSCCSNQQEDMQSRYHTRLASFYIHCIHCLLLLLLLMGESSQSLVSLLVLSAS